MTAHEDLPKSTANLADPAELEISVYHSFDEVETDWRDFEANAECFAFQHFAWLRNWYKIAGESDAVEACLVVIGDRVGEPYMLLPLGIQRRRFATCLIWLGGVLSDYHGPILHRNFPRFVNEYPFAAIWEDVQERLPRFDAVIFEKQPEFIAAHKNPFVGPSSRAHPSNAHHTMLSGSLESFISSKRSKKSISTEKRKERRLAEHGEIRFVVAKTDEEVKELLPVLMRQKGTSYSKLGVRNLFDATAIKDFVEYMSANHNNTFVLLCGLTVGDRTAATFWGLVYKQRLYYLLPAYENDELTKYSPGNILLRHIFDWCFSNGVSVFDFTVGDEPYKEFWCDQVTRLYDNFESKSIKGFFYVQAFKTQRDIKRRIKQSPLLSKAYVSARKQKKLFVRKH